MITIKRTEASADRKRVYFNLELLASGGPANGEAGGQPQISINGGALVNTVNVLVFVGFGLYYVQLDDTEINYSELSLLNLRYSSANVFEARAQVQIIEATNKDIFDAVEANSPQQHFAEVTSAVLFGATVSGSYLDTFLDNNISWVIQPGASGMDVQLDFNVGIGRIGVEVNLNGKFDANPNRFTDAFVYNYVTLLWDQISDVDTRMNNSNTHQDYDWFLTSQHVNPSNGDVHIRLVSSSTVTGDRLEIDRIRVLSLSEASGLTPTLIAEAVWDHDVTGHIAHETAAFHLSAAVPAIGQIIAVTDESNFQADGLAMSDNALTGLAIWIHDELNDLYYPGVIQSNDTAGNIVLYEPLAQLPVIGDAVVVRNQNFDHERDRVDVGSINGAPIAGELVPGVLQPTYTIRDNKDQIIYSDDTPTLLVIASEGWDFTGKEVWFAAKLDLDSGTAIVNRKCTILDSRRAQITLTAAETATPEKYFGEFSQTDLGGVLNQKTIQRFGLVIRKDVRE
jgi:hypothetical protein